MGIGILILTAVDLETAALARQLELPLLPAFPFRVHGRGDVRVAPVGLRAGLLHERWPQLSQGFSSPVVVSAGLCGGLAPRLRAGDLFLPDTVLAPSGELLRVSAPVRERLLARAGGRAHTGCLVTTRAVAATPEDKASLHAETGAAAVDTESAAILGHAGEAGCPALVVRGVSDDAAQAVPPALQRLLTAEGRVRGGRVFALALTQPRTIAHALALRRGSRLALDAVARSLAMLVA